MAEAQPFGLWLKRCRKILDLTQQELARRAGYSVQTIEKIESGARRPSKEVAARLAVCLEIPAEERAGFVQWARSETRAAGPPPVPGGRRAPHNLPAPPNSFIGREREVVQAGGLLDRAGVRLLTLTGPPGIGKTRLALEVARAGQDAFAQGIALVPLAALRDPGLVVSAIAAALGVREVARQPLQDSLQEALRDQQRLLVLDNFEQVLAAAPLVGELLAAAPGLKVLATSRTALRLYGEHELRLTSLALPDGRRRPSPSSDTGRLLRYPALALFVERAQAVAPDFVLTADNAGAVAALCRRLDGLPLAIELAAARTRTHTPALLLASLTGTAGRAPLDLLVGGARDVPPRQRTLRAAIAWSYDLLDLSEQQLFRRLAVFAGGCTAEAAAAVAPGPDTAQSAIPALLASLVDKSLLRLAEAPLRSQADGAAPEAAVETVETAPRYQTLETIREYGLERLAAHGELEAVRRQHAVYYLALVEQAVPALRHPERAEWLARLERDHDNLRAALDWAVAQEDWELALRLAGAIRWFWIRGGYMNEGRQRLAGLLAYPATALYPALRATVLQGAGSLAWYQDDYAAAGVYWEEALDLFRQVDDQSSSASMLNNLGSLANSQRDYPTARRFYEDSLVHTRALGNHYLTAGLLHNLSGVALNQGDLPAFQAFEEECLALGRALGYKEIMAFALAGLGTVAQQQGDYTTAYVHYRECLVLRREFGDKVQIAPLLIDLGFVAYHRGDVQRAHTLLTEGLALSLETGTRRPIAIGLVGVAMLNAAQGQAAGAARLLGVATALHQATGLSIDGPAQADYEQTLAVVRAQLPADEFAAAWTAGQALTVAQAAAEAMTTTPVASAPAAQRRQRAAPATTPA